MEHLAEQLTLRLYNEAFISLIVRFLLNPSYAKKKKKKTQNAVNSERKIG